MPLSVGRRKSRRHCAHVTKLCVEVLEDLCVLSTMADVVFLVDNSESDIVQGLHSNRWLRDVITGDFNRDDIKDPEEKDLSEVLAAQGIGDVRYGLVAFGEQYLVDNTYRFAHSEPVGSQGVGVFDRLWSDGATATEHLSDLTAALDHLVENERGGVEDGWDAIDHAIAEYEFRPGAVPIFILVQNTEGRNIRNPFELPPSTIVQNSTLMHDGILAALKSKNVILNTIVQGRVESGTVHYPLFDLSRYEVMPGDFSTIKVLGVDASYSGNGMHAYHAYDTSTNSVPTTLPQTSSEALQISHNGSNTGATGMVATGKSILFGTNLSDGIGPSSAGYRAKSVPFQSVEFTTSNSTSIAAGSALPNFTFNYFGTNHVNQVRPNEDGTISFGPTAFSSGGNRNLSGNIFFEALDPRPTVPIIAALWEVIWTFIKVP
jgi:hypothetical protein